MVSLPNSSTKDVFKCCACVARVAAAERKKAGDLRTGSSLVQPISGRLAGMADFPKYFFRLAWRPAALVQTRYALHAAAMHRHMAKPEDWPYSRDCVRGCVLHAWLHRHFAHRSPCSVPTGYRPRSPVWRMRWHHAPLSRECGCGRVCVWAGGGNCAQSRGANRSQSEETATENSQVKQARPWLLKSIVDMWSVVGVGLLGF